MTENPSQPLPDSDRGDSAIMAQAGVLLESAPDAIIVLNEAGHIVFVNRSTESLFGYGRAELLGSPIETLIPPRDHAAHVDYHAVLHPQPSGRRLADEQHNLLARRRDGGEFPVDVRLSAVVTAEQRLVLNIIRDATERRRIEREVRESEAWLRSIAENVPHVYLGVVDRDMIVRFASGREMRVRGFDPQQFIGMHVQQAFSPYGSEAVASILEGYARGFAGEEAEFELTLDELHLLFRVVPMSSDTRVVERILVLVEDITERKRFENALRESETRLRNILDSMSALVGLLSVDGILLDVNRAPLELAGLRREDVLGRHVADTFWLAHSPAAQAQVSRAVRRAAAGETIREDVVVQIREGRLLTVDAIFGPLYDHTGRVVQIVSSAIDITTRKRSEALVAGQKRVLEMISAGASLADTFDELNRVIEAQAAELLCSILLLDEGNRITHCSGPSLPAKYNAQIDRIPIGPSVASCGTSAWRREPVFVADIETDPLWEGFRHLAQPFGLRSCWSTPILDRNGEVLGTFAIYGRERGLPTREHLRLIDAATHIAAICITRHRGEEALRRSEERFRQVVETIHEVFWITDVRNSRVLYLSPSFERIWGVPVAAVYENRNRWLDSVHPDDRTRVAATTLQPPARDFEIDYRIVRPDGEVRWIRGKVFPVVDEQGRIDRVVGVAEDVTARVELEAHLRQAQKMESIGQLSGGLAHDFNNLLTVVRGHISLLEIAPGLDDTARESIREIKEAAERATNLTRQLLTFSRRQAIQRRHLDLNDVVTQMSRMLQRLLGEPIRIELQLTPAGAPVLADRGMLDQVLLNLALNARDAMPDGGTLIIRTECRTAADPELSVCLTVTDTGTGIAPEVLPRIFEPFFTTKPVGKGTGLGLATVYGIVQQHGGRVEVDSQPGDGARFRVWFPNAPSEPAGVTLETSEGGAAGGQEGILLVEDERALRTLVSRLLKQFGYRLFEASNGPEALERWREHRAAIDLVITDLVMPDGMSGFDVAEEIQRDRPGVPVIFTSGYSAELEEHGGRLKPGANFLAKPFDLDLLIATVRRALDQRQRR